MSEYLSEEEQIAKMKTWWGQNGTSLVLSIVVGIVVIVGWRWYDSYSEDQVHEASRAYALYLAASPEDKAVAAAQISDDFKGTAYHAFVLFQQARDALAKEDFLRAEQLLQQVIDEADDILLVDLARIRIAKLQYALDRSSEALSTLDAISNEGYRSMGLETKGDIYAGLGQVELAHVAYRAALDSLDPAEQRPILEMKAKNVAPFNGEYVEFSATLSDALEQAQQTLDEAAAAEKEATQPPSATQVAAPQTNAQETESDDE